MKIVRKVALHRHFLLLYHCFFIPLSHQLMLVRGMDCSLTAETWGSMWPTLLAEANPVTLAQGPLLICLVNVV